MYSCHVLLTVNTLHQTTDCILLFDYYHVHAAAHTFKGCYMFNKSLYDNYCFFNVTD